MTTGIVGDERYMWYDFGSYTGFVVDQYQTLNAQQDEFTRKAESLVPGVQ